MKNLTKPLLVTQALTLVGLGFALWVAYGPASAEEMAKSRFYFEGEQHGFMIGNDEYVKNMGLSYTTCTGALEFAIKDEARRDLNATAKMTSTEDHDAFLAGCKASLMEKYDKKN
ncbi:hypothetical protein GCM10022419_016100 [Nonomuraea rosea]|uniref:DUF732 domain-containing protein n=1 Tax=Nonomuraea rosea TaxID=638574 RepID=A0ABP6VQ51_9ACTN